uniref:protein-tyrosine-phosphatase n=1 Tax=Crassostrea virginica TaxID=6565 RepID=A0A8B8BSC5_CRAVI|nr:receptor-type tyrosine-protein phosphatase epsilon-like [Crassostrea virginica]
MAADPTAAVIFFLQFCAQGQAYLQLVKPNHTIATSSSTYLGYLASRTVDGDVRQQEFLKRCSHTDVRKDITLAWLRVDLKEAYSIKSVKFWYRNDRRHDLNTIRLRGFSIRVSNDTALPESSCYTDPGDVTLPTIIEKDCERTARHVWIYQNNTLDGACPMLEICEVKVFGCNLGKYAENCSKNCNHCKNNASCGAATGKCNNEGCALSGFQVPFCQKCKNGYTGENCDEKCSGNKYGENCSKPCGHCIHHNCSHVNGSCLSGCEAGYKQARCDTPCDKGEYGRGCKHNCSGNCRNGEVCDPHNGTCPSCADGFQGIKCDKKCCPRRYGENCSGECGECLNSGDCYHVDGNCTKGCKPGWQPTKLCKEACKEGTYGVECGNKCSGNCFNKEPCNKITGNCKTCLPGWKEPLCNETCGTGRYGPMCSIPCGFCNESDVCFPTNGSCPRGCKDGYTGEMCNIRILKVKSTFADVFGLEFSTLLLIGISVVLVILIIVTTGLVVLFRKRSQKKRNEEDNCLPEAPEAEDEEDENCQQDEDNIIYDDIQIRSKGIKITELQETIKSLAKDKKKGFQEEFHAVPYGEQPDIACTVGKLTENIPKNRFKTTFPYDHSRVVLQSSKNGDYINANYIKNADSDVAYIASQGPKPNTVADFWKMVWQEHVSVIAMVTNLTEGEKKKCERYWPFSRANDMVKDYFLLKLKSEKTYANFVIHEIDILNRESNETRHVTHLQYTAWPDHGTPTPLELLVFYRYVSKAVENNPANKLLVHCSAGIGRTGTFIALDALHRQGQKTGRINIVEYVHSMREDRMNMIQNANQYEFLYEVLFESFRGKSYTLTKEDLVPKVELESTQDKAVNLSDLNKEFQELESLRPTFLDEETELAKFHLDLNMTRTVLPLDNMRVTLTSQVAGRDNYYNAVPISAVNMRDCIIAAQYPVPGASVDLIRLLVDNYCSTLVSIHPLSDIPSSLEWFTKSSLSGYQVNVSHKTRLSDHVMKTTMKIHAPKSHSGHKLTVYEITTWRSGQTVPPDVNAVVDAVRSTENIDPKHKMAVFSRDGATGCGVFCAVYNALQQLQQDDEVDLFTIVRLLHSRRPQMIANVNEYVFCYQVLADFIKSESEDVYMNAPTLSVSKEENVYANT